MVDLSTVFDDPDILTAGDVLVFDIVSSTGDGSLFDDLSITGSDLTIDLAPDAFDAGGIEVTVSATDNQPQSVEDTFSVVVNEVFPAAQDDVVVVDEDPDGFILIDVLANDDLGDNPTQIISYGVDLDGYTNITQTEWTIQSNVIGIQEQLPNGSLSINADNQIQYVPKENFYGPDFFTYTIRDADGDESTATVNITVNPIDDAPRVFGAPEYTVDQGEFLNIEAAEGLLSFVTDDDGDAVEVRVVVPPPCCDTYINYSVTEEDGSFDFTPRARLRRRRLTRGRSRSRSTTGTRTTTC